MKNFVSVCLLSFPFFGFGQLSYEFSQPLPPGGEPTLIPQVHHFGLYKSDRSDIVFELSEKGIFTVSTIIQSVSKDSIRESSNYIVRNNYLFGIKGIDSIQVVLQDNRYFFGIQHKEEIVGPNSKNVLNPISKQSYMLNFFENNAYQPCIFSIVEGDLSIQYFDYPIDTKIFSKVPQAKKTEEQYMMTITLAPARADFADIDFPEMFGSERKYKRVN